MNNDKDLPGLNYENLGIEKDLSPLKEMQSMGQKMHNKMVEQLVSTIMKHRNKILEDFSIAYIAETGLSIKDIVLIETRTEGGNPCWHFTKRAGVASG